MSAPHVRKVAGIDPAVPSPTHNVAPLPPTPAPPAAGAVLQDRLAGWVSDLTTLHEHTERLTRTRSTDGALHELLRAGAALVGARRGFVVLGPAGDDGPSTTVGLGLGHADLGHLETVPRGATSYGRLLDGLPGSPRPGEIVHPDLFGEPGLDPRHREVAARLGYAASYALPLAAETSPRLGAAVWLYDEPAEPTERRRHLAGLYTRYAAEHLARLMELEHARAQVATVAEELLPSRLPRVAGVRLAARHRTGPHGRRRLVRRAAAARGRPGTGRRIGLRIGAQRPGRDGAAAGRPPGVRRDGGRGPRRRTVDLELLLRLTEPARSATALFAYCEPAGALQAGGRGSRIVLAGAGHSPPLVIGARRTEYVETSLSAPLGMLSCWEAPSVELAPAPGETVLLYTDGLLQRTGDPMDRAFARLHAAAASVPRADRDDPGAIADHVLRTVLPDGGDTAESAEDIVLLAARFD